VLEIAEKIQIVLVETSHPGNIGAAARAMKTMGLNRLVLVNPAQYPCVEATARAAGADDVLAKAVVTDSLKAGISDASYVLGTSARLRTLRWPGVDPSTAAVESLQTIRENGSVALVFGRESSGLTNEELSLCHKLVHIPVNPDYSSLNLAAAVQVLCYEIRSQFTADDKPLVVDDSGEKQATAHDMEDFMRHLENTLIKIDYMDPANPRKSMPRLRRLFHRARMSRNEVNLLRGVLKQMSKLAD